MVNPVNYPLIVFVLSLFILWSASLLGIWLRKNVRNLEEKSRDDFKFVLGGALTLLGLIIGFTFEMAVHRYDHRKNLEAEEANAIGTEYDRADLLPSSDSARLHELLKSYLDKRISTYNSQDEQRLQQLRHETDRLQDEMWSAVSASGTAHPSAITALTVGGMNNVLDSQGYVHAARLNRIPTAAWALVIVMCVFCNLLLGYGTLDGSRVLSLILPIALSVSLFLIADIDTTRRGVIRVHPQNLERLAESLHSR
jgi:uncharacterized membrane protein